MDTSTTVTSTIAQRAHAMREVAPAMASSSIDTRNQALLAIADALRTHAQEIFAANKSDLEQAQSQGVAPALLARLRYDEHKLADSLAQLEGLVALPDPLGVPTLSRELADGLVLRRVSVPIGVIGVIFEARPDALVQISSLCIKSGNCAILKGGRETTHTNTILFELIQAAATSAGLPAEALAQASSHADIDDLLSCDSDVDLLIPRGSNNFVRYIMEHTRIPVMGHSSGVCHVYVDAAADQELATRVIIDAKTQYPVACNAAETLLVNRAIAAEFLPKVASALANKGVRLRVSADAAALIGHDDASEPVELMGDDEWGREYGDLVLSVGVVDTLDEAIAHINRWGSHHTDAIITTDDAAAARFAALVDSAGVYRNCSTRFADGYRYGFGAEVGISTGKLHARGPVGLDGLVTYKYLLEGHGDIVADFAEGRRSFTHRDLA